MTLLIHQSISNDKRRYWWGLRTQTACFPPWRMDGLNHFCTVKTDKPPAHRRISQSQWGFYLVELSYPASCAAAPHGDPRRRGGRSAGSMSPPTGVPCRLRAATPALNGESPSGGEAATPESSSSSRRFLSGPWTLWSGGGGGRGTMACADPCERGHGLGIRIKDRTDRRDPQQKKPSPSSWAHR